MVIVFRDMNAISIHIGFSAI